MLEIELYNTLSRKKERLEPLTPGRVGLYVCGPTVYDRAHIGNARPVIVFDLLFRLLRHVYGEANVSYVRNITDVDDKIIDRAGASLEPGETLNDAIRRITEQTAAWYREDMEALGALTPTHEPRATEHIEQMVAMIEALIENGAAYEAEGHVLFSVKAYEGYGKLSGRSVEDMIAGARVEVAPYKRDPMDFVLWKPSSAEEPGWPSPWGVGRPGWHIECSAMSREILGDSFDIHGGGVDLVFPHHENERAQSLCAHPEGQFAKIWMHNGFVQVEGEKMSKSLGNFITVHDLRDRAPGVVIRMAMLKTHYRQPFDWTERLAAESRKDLEKWSDLFDPEDAPEEGEPDEKLLAALADDLNTPRAIARLHELYRSAARGGPEGETAQAKLYHSALLMGFDLREIDFSLDYALVARFDDAYGAAVDRLIARRSEARAARDFAEADRIRDMLIAAGVEVEDGKDGATWRWTSAATDESLGALREEAGDA